MYSQVSSSKAYWVVLRMEEVVLLYEPFCSTLRYPERCQGRQLSNEKWLGTGILPYEIQIGTAIMRFNRSPTAPLVNSHLVHLKQNLTKTGSCRTNLGQISLQGQPRSSTWYSFRRLSEVTSVDSTTLPGLNFVHPGSWDRANRWIIEYLNFSGRAAAQPLPAVCKSSFKYEFVLRWRIKGIFGLIFK
jgi:hypothetical protein